MLRAAAAGRDITPALEGDFFGYVRPDLRAKGVALRLRALALVLDDGRRRIALLTLDLGAPLVTREILQRLGPLGYDRSNPLIAATHTHAGPSRPGPWVAQQAAEAVAEAGDSLRGARAGWGEARVDDANQSRSLEAHLANHGLDLYPGTGSCDLDPDGSDHPRDVGLRLLRVEDDDGGPLAAWAHFSAHPTTFVPANTRFSADYPATARWHFRAAIRAEAEPAPPTAMLANGAEGDLITRYDEVNQHALADRIGARVADAMRRAWDAAGPLTGEVAVDGRTERVVYAGQRVAPGRRVASRAWFGLPFLGGGRNGPSWLYGLGLEGRRRPRPLAGPVHGRKLVVAPAPWPPHAHVTVVRVGDRLLMGVPGEPTVEAGRRMRAAALAAVRKADPDTPVVDALVVGLAQSYRGYFTTPEEYDQQHYEGGHTVFGRHTSLVVERAHARLAAALAEERGADAAPDEPGGGNEHDDPPPAVPAPVGLGAGPTRMLRQPPPRVSRFETLALVVAAPPRGRARPVDAPLLVLQRRTADGGWQPVDDDLGIGFVWHQRGRRLTARYEIPHDLPTGTHRILVSGPTRVLATRAFAVQASHGLRPLGVERHGDRLVLRAQHPPPDARVALRARDRHPTGGEARLLAGDRSAKATWDAEAGGWVADLAAERVTVPAGGLVDGHGNRSGPAVELAVGMVRAVEWAPMLGPGGGHPPGPFGWAGASRP